LWGGQDGSSDKKRRERNPSGTSFGRRRKEKIGKVATVICLVQRLDLNGEKKRRNQRIGGVKSFVREGGGEGSAEDKKACL